MGKGWIKVHRSVMDNKIWNDKPFAYGQAWIDLLLLADHEDIGIYKKGCVYKSQHELADRWGWSRGKVRRFLELLLSQEMILLKSQPCGTTITLVKYGFYQNGETTKKTTKKTTNDTTDDTYTRNKEYKEEREEMQSTDCTLPEEDDEGYMNPRELWRILHPDEGDL